MTETTGDYKVGHGKPPVGTRFKKGQSGNLGGRSTKTALPLLVRKFEEQVVVATGGRRQKTTRREVVMVQLVDQPAGASLSATTFLAPTKFLADMVKEFEKAAGLSSRPVEIK